MSAYHSIARDIGRRPRRLPCFTGVSLLAAALLGVLVGTALSSALWAHRAAAQYQRIDCVLRSSQEPFIRTGLDTLAGFCQTGAQR